MHLEQDVLEGKKERGKLVTEVPILLREDEEPLIKGDGCEEKRDWVLRELGKKMEILERFITGKYGSESMIKEVKCTDLICVGCGGILYMGIVYRIDADGRLEWRVCPQQDKA